MATVEVDGRVSSLTPRYNFKHEVMSHMFKTGCFFMYFPTLSASSLFNFPIIKDSEKRRKKIKKIVNEIKEDKTEK